MLTKKIKDSTIPINIWEMELNADIINICKEILFKIKSNMERLSIIDYIKYKIMKPLQLY